MKNLTDTYLAKHNEMFHIKRQLISDVFKSKHVYFQYNNHNFSTCNIKADVFKYIPLKYSNSFYVTLFKYKCKRWLNIMKEDTESNIVTEYFPPKSGNVESKKSRI